MGNIITHSNFLQDLVNFRREFDQIFNRMLTGSPRAEERASTESRVYSPAVDLYMDKSHKTFHCLVSLAGVAPEDVQIQAQGNNLMIRGERHAAHTGKDTECLHGEIWYGTFERNLTLPEGIDLAKLNAEYRHGVLDITAPVEVSALPRRIEIKTGQTLTKAA